MALQQVVSYSHCNISLTVDLEGHLVSRIAQHDEQAVAEFDRIYRNQVINMARRAGVPAEDCEDVAQEALLDTVRAIQSGQFKGHSSLKTFLIGILKHKMASYFRKQKPINQMTVRSDNDESEGLQNFDNVSGLLTNTDIRLMTEKALLSLSEEQRLILLLNQMGGFTIREIARRIGRSEGRVGAILAEAKRNFREALLST